MSTMRTPETAGDAGPLAPRDPETFFKAQRRNRRATWRMSALCVFAAFLMGIPLTLVLTPFLYAVTMAMAEVVNHFSPLPPEFWQTANDLAKLAYRVADFAINQRGTLDFAELAAGLVLVFLPGIVLAIVLWLGILLLFRHAGVGGTIASLNARAPNPADLKELQLANVVQEMAIAAGLPAPQVMLIDSLGANSAAIGTSPADAHIVLSRRLLDDLNRDQLQAFIGHLMMSVGNGDLRIAFTVTSVFESCGLITALINAPFGNRSRSTLWRILRYAVKRAPACAKSADADEVAELLADTLDMSSSDIDRFFNSEKPGLIRKFFRAVFFPFQFTNMGVEITLWFFLSVLLGPCMALLWRARRYLADAGAIELTRNPDALASALQRVSEDDTSVAGAGWATHLFILNPRGDRSLRGRFPSTDQQRKALEAWRATAAAGAAVPLSTNPAPRPGADREEYARARKEIISLAMAATAGDTNARARLQAFALRLGSDPAIGIHGIPNFNDIYLAQRGDRAAIARVRMLRQTNKREDQLKRGRTGLQTHSFVSFHPPLNKRIKRLQKMGAHLTTPSRTGSAIARTILFTILYLVLVPLMTVAGVAILLLIAFMIGLNLVFLALWLTLIHWAFAQSWDQNIRSFVEFFEELTAAFSRGR
jgi:Zn-dependent protease with chaperone function